MNVSPISPFFISPNSVLHHVHCTEAVMAPLCLAPAAPALFARSLGSVGCLPDVSLLIGKFGGCQDGYVRKSLIEEMGIARSPAARPFLAGLLADSGEPVALRGAAAMALGKLGGPESVESLLQAYRGIRLKPAPKVFLPAKKDEGLFLGESVLSAFGSVGKIEDTRAHDLLVSVACDEALPMSLRLAAVASWGETGDASSAGKLIALFGEGKNWSKGLPKKVMVALGAIGGPDAEAFLSGILHDAARPEPLRTLALSILTSTTGFDEKQLAGFKADENPQLRQTAVAFLEPTAENFPALLDALQDDDERVRYTAFESLLRTGDERLPAVLERLAREHASFGMRCKSVEALQTFGGPAALDAAVGALSDSSFRVVHVGVSALKDVDNPRVVTALIKAGAKVDRFPYDQKAKFSNGVSAILHRFPRESAQKAVEIFPSEDGEGRLWILKYLNSLDDPSLEVFLRGVVENEAESAAARAVAAEGLASCRDLASVKALIRAASTENPLSLGDIRWFRNAAKASLDKGKRLKNMELMLEVLLDALRRVAISALGGLRDPRTLGIQVLALLGDSDPIVRRMALMYLEKNPSPDATEALIAAFQSDADPENRRAAVVAVAKAKSPRSLEVLLSGTQDRDSQVRSTCGSFLNSVRDPRAVGAQKELLRSDPDPTVRRLIAWKLRERKLQDAEAPLLAALREDADPEVRLEAAHSLGRLKSKKAVADLRRLLEQAPDEKTTRVASMALLQITGVAS